MSEVTLSKRKVFTVPLNTPITEKLIQDVIQLHRTQLLPKYLENENMYMSDFAILREKSKEAWKPDNRLVINLAKYAVDTFGGFHLGVPLKVSHDNQQVADFVADLRKDNDMEDTEFECAKMVDIFGHAFFYVYQDEDATTRITYNSPVNMLIVHDNTVAEKPLFALRYAMNQDGLSGTGELITDKAYIQFVMNKASDITFGEEEAHLFGRLPVIEFIENEERQGLFDSAKTLINALSKVTSEKANDVDYFADSYLKVVGIELDEDVTKQIRDNRVFNLWGDYPNMDVSFLDRPSADTTQQNLIELLLNMSFTTMMIANISDEDFGNASGTALAFKLQPMSNLAKMKDRKMQSAMNRLYQVIFNLPLTQVSSDEWQGLKYVFTRNMPRNILEEAQIVAELDGRVSDETKLSVLSIIDNPKDELKKIEDEQLSNSQLNQQLTLNERKQTDADVFGVVPSER